MSKAKPAPKPTKHRNTWLTVALIIVFIHGILMAAIFWNVRTVVEKT